jgi:hypothetical protein
VVGQAGTSACFKLKNKEGTASGWHWLCFKTLAKIQT